MAKALGLLFQTEEDQLYSKNESLPFTQLEKKDILHKLHSILEACEIYLAQSKGKQDNQWDIL